MEQAKSGNATPGITFQGVFDQIGKGAIIGAVINVGISSVAHYSEYKNGIISGNEYANILIKDSAKGGLTGGSMAAVNIPIQIAAKAIGVGFPVTIPVMIIVSYGLKQVIDPMFGEGKYKEILVEMNYTDDLIKGIAAFSYISTAAFEMQKHYVREINKLAQRAHIINQYDQAIDQMLDKAIGEI